MTLRRGPAPWNVENREILADHRVFRVRKDVCRSPKTSRLHEFFVLEGSDWINVVATTVDDQIVLIRQFRHGAGEVTLEIPGGSVDPSDSSPLEAARRELLEETGFASDHWVEIGRVNPNPAIQANTCHTFLARNAVKVAEPALDGTEDIEVEVFRVSELDSLVREGHITHALVLAALHFFRLGPSGASRA